MWCSNPMRRGLIAAGSLLALAGLGGCAAQQARAILADQRPGLTPTEQYGLKVTSRPEQVAIGLHPTGLSANQQTALSQFVSAWRDDGGGDITVRVPSDSADPRIARRMAEAAVAFVQHLGAPAERVRIEGYAAGGGPLTPVLVSYEKFQTLGPNCSNRWDNQLGNFNNAPSAHFGCVVTANVGAQIANPRDLLAPAQVTPADDGRREFVLGKYRQGQTTSTAQDDQASGHVSAVQQ